MSQPRSQSHILAAREHNTLYVPLLQLPTEIFLMIFSYFSTSDANTIAIMALRSTCVRMSTLLRQPLIISDVIQQKYSNLLRSRKLAALCQLERQGLLPKGELTCAACVSSHESRYFSNGVDKQAPETRKCIGSTGYVHLCNHLSVSHEQLRTGGRQFWCGLTHGNPNLATRYVTPMSFRGRKRQGWYTNRKLLNDSAAVFYYSQAVRRIGPRDSSERGVFLGPRSVYNQIYGQIDEKRGSVEQKSRHWLKWKREHRRKESKLATGTSKDEDLILRAEYIVLRSTPESTFDKMLLPSGRIATRIHTTLTLADWDLSSQHRLCPHISSTLIEASLRKNDNAGLSWGEYLQCPNAQCRTSVRFEVERAYTPKAEGAEKDSRIEPMDEIVMIVERNLGPGKDVTDDRWVSQVEQSNPYLVIWV